MKNEYTVKISDLALTDAQKVMAKKLGISERFLRLLLGRGFLEEDIHDFLHPSLNNLSSPFEIDGMKRAVSRIKQAIDSKERILIYGDYDCDGICAVSTLMLYLRDKAAVSYFIPDRARDGYGMSVSSLERIIQSYKPSLVISVDCGITAVKEAEYLKARGIDLIVTDHHEPQEQLPDCIVLDPKVGRHGFYDLCGAGVAFKLVEAMAGRDEACKYIDIVAIATIADVVPLKEDNRIIAYYGLKRIKQAPRQGIKQLLGEDTVSSHSVMFRLAPRMNAAGRLNSAMKVVGLFLEDDYFMLKTLAEELTRDNALRQELCEQTVKEAKDMLKGVDFGKMGIIALYSDKWEAGVLGIAASKLVEAFKRPAVLFAKNANGLKGSARSIPSVNIFELFSELSGFFTAFGGHSQAAGVSIEESKFEDFKTAANALIFKTHSVDEFIPPVKCEMELPLDFDYLSFIQELELMEPTGYGNPRPTFLIKGDGLKFEKFGHANHVKCVQKNVDLLGFSLYGDMLSARTGKTNLEVSLDINCFRNILTAQGVLRSVGFENICIEDDEAKVLNLHHLDYNGGAYVSSVDIATVDGLLKASPFGTVIVCFSSAEYEHICTLSETVRDLPVTVGSETELNPCNRVVVCPSAQFDYAYYKTVVVAGRPLSSGYIAHIVDEAGKCLCLGDCSHDSLRVSDDELRAIYKAILQIAMSKTKASNMHALYLQVCERYKTAESTFMLALKIFGQLGLVNIGEKGAISVSRKSVSLTNSQAYRNIEHI